MKNLLNIALSLSVIAGGFSAYAEPSKTYQATIVADCSELNNCPLVKGDTLLTSNTSRSGLPLRNAILILGLNTQVKVVNLSPQIKEFNLIKGIINLNILKNQPQHVYQINAGQLLKIVIKEAGYYRVSVSQNQKETMVQVIKGRAEIRIGKITRVIKQGQTANIKETDSKSPLDINVQRPLYDNDYTLSPIITASNTVPVSSPDPDSTARPEIIPDADLNDRNSIDYNAIPNQNSYSKPITGTTSVVTPEAIPDANREEMNAKPYTNNQVSGTTTDLTPGANSQESLKKVITKPSERVLSRPVTQPQIDRHPGVRSEALIPHDTRPQSTRDEGIRHNPLINTDAQTSRRVIPDANPEDPRNTPHLIEDTNQEFENNGN